MLRKNLQNVSKKTISITMIIIIIYTLINALICNKSYAITQVRNMDSNNIYNIDENLYPGYATLLKNLKTTHPNWTFTLFYTDLEWSEVLMNETTANHARSLVQGKTGEWLCTDPQCDGIPHDGASWFGASQTAVAYYMDTRNFLTEDKIFQFEALSYIPSVHTEAGVEAVLRGSFMSNTKISDYYGNSNYGDKTFAQTIMYAAEASGVSPYHIASRIRQEVGTNGSDSITGKVSGYEGYFNFYNIGAYASSDPVINGLIYAKRSDVNWDTPEKSIVGGAKWIANEFISKGQDTIYLQRWDVDNQYLGLYWHLYQTNIQAPASESSTVYSSYKSIFNNDLTNTNFNFIIPMYKNMPISVSRYPSSSTYVSQNAKIYDVIGSGVNIRREPAGTLIGTYSNGYQFLRIELKAAKVNGITWDKIMLQDGTMAYIATQYVVETTQGELSKEAYINANAELLNGPRVVQNGTTNVRQLFTGQLVTILEEGKYNFDGYSWTKIKLQDGSYGYIQSGFVTEGTYGEKVTITCNTELALRDSPYGSIIKYIEPGVIVNRIEKATTQVSGYYWDKVITYDGLVGYMARERYNPYSLWLTPVNGDNIIPSTPDDKLLLNETEKTIKVIPQTILSDIKEKYEDAVLVSGTENLGTGSKVSINGVEYTIIKLGDVSGDGEVDARDSLRILKYTVGSFEIKNEYIKAADLNGDEIIDARDSLRILKYTVGSYSINL